MFSVKPSLGSDKDVVNLLESLAGNFEGVVQYNRDNTAFEVCAVAIECIGDDEVMGIILPRVILSGFQCIKPCVWLGGRVSCSNSSGIRECVWSEWITVVLSVPSSRVGQTTSPLSCCVG